MNILLTGGAGLLGREIAGMLKDKHQLLHYEIANPGDGLPWHEGNLLQGQELQACCEGMDVMIHAAALHGKRWAEAGDDTGFRVNTEGTKNILEAAVKCGVRRVVFTSSIWAAGHLPGIPPYLPLDEKAMREPQELYGLTKKLGESMCTYYSARYGLVTVCLRAGGILRPLEDFRHQKGLLFGGVDVRDVAAAHVLAAEMPDLRGTQSEVFVITAESPLCGLDLGAWKESPIQETERIIPGIRTVMTEDEIKSIGTREWYTVEKAKKILGYQPQYNFQP